LVWRLGDFRHNIADIGPVAITRNSRVPVGSVSTPRRSLAGVSAWSLYRKREARGELYGQPRAPVDADLTRF
jgi:hypothetical protein